MRRAYGPINPYIRLRILHAHVSALWFASRAKLIRIPKSHSILMLDRGGWILYPGITHVYAARFLRNGKISALVRVASPFSTQRQCCARGSVRCRDIFSQLRGRSNLIVPKFIMMAAGRATAKRPFSFETAAAVPQAI